MIKYTHKLNAKLVVNMCLLTYVYWNKTPFIKKTVENNKNDKIYTRCK